MRPLLICAVLFLAASARAAKDAPDDIADIYRDSKRAAFVFRHRVEFHDLKGLKPAVIAENGKPDALKDGAPARGRPALIDRDGKIARPEPRKTVRFKEGVYPAETRRPAASAFLVCTSEAWGVTSASSTSSGFCGAFSLDGKELFSVEPEKEAGLILEPVGLASDAKEALFALTKKRKDGGREIVGYRVWKKGRPAETLAAEGARVKALIEKYEGPFVLPSQQRGAEGR